MGGHAVPQRVRRNGLGEFEFLRNTFDAALNGAGTHRRRRHRGRLAVAPVGRKEQTRVAVLFPVVSAVRCNVLSGSGNVTIFGAFAAMDVDRHSLGVDVADLQVESFFKPQPQRVERPQKSRVVMLPCGHDQLMDFVDRQHFG